MATLPQPRGETSEILFRHLSTTPHALPRISPPTASDPLADEDLQLSLYVCYELHYRGFEGVSDHWEWEPSLIGTRRSLERRFELALCDLVPPVSEVAPSEIDSALRDLAAQDSGSLSRYIENDASLEQLLEFLVHRSAYQLKEADPHSWALPRLFGAPKAALVEIQVDEYGGGRPERIHAQLFADTLSAVGLEPEYGAYLDVLPGVTLATVNLMSMFGLNRRLRGAIVGHLALFEMSSSIPNARYAAGLRRLGCDGVATGFFDEHVEADAVHEQIAAVDLAGGLARQQPEIAGDVIWGAQALAELDGRWGRHLLERWRAGQGSLLPSAGINDGC